MRLAPLILCCSNAALCHTSFPRYPHGEVLRSLRRYRRYGCASHRYITCTPVAVSLKLPIISSLSYFTSTFYLVTLYPPHRFLKTIETSTAESIKMPNALSGPALARARLAFLVLPGFLLYGYNQSNLGGVLAYPSFIKYFPLMDSSTTTGAKQAQNAKIRGQLFHIANTCQSTKINQAPLWLSIL